MKDGKVIFKEKPDSPTRVNPFPVESANLVGKYNLSSEPAYKQSWQLSQDHIHSVNMCLHTRMDTHTYIHVS